MRVRSRDPVFGAWEKPVFLGWLLATSTLASAQVATTVPKGSQSTADAPQPVPASPDPPSAQPEPPPPDQAPIIITGSRIPRPNLTAVSPVAMITQDEVKREGTVLIEELLNQLPQVAPSQGAFISNGALGIATVDLRNLGPARTLVLVNGRRLGPGDPSTPLPDLNMIPTTLVQRTEVLTGGATSVYGSDAVSGVVNFILDTRFTGLRVDAQTSVYQHDNRNGSGLGSALDELGLLYPKGNSVDGGRQDFNVAFGRGLFEDRLHVTVYGGYRKLAPLTQDRRDYSACAAFVNPDDNSQLFCGGSFAAFPANFFTNFPVPLVIGPDRTFEPGINFFNYAPYNFYQRSDRRYTVGGFFDADVGPAMKPYVELMFMDDRSVAQIAPSGDFGNTANINCDNPLLSEQQRSLICVDGNFVGQRILFDDDGNVVEVQGDPIPFVDPVTGATYFRANLQVARRGVDSGGRRDDFRHKTLRWVAGFKGDVGRGITYDASFMSDRAKMTDAHTNDFSITRLTRALDVITDPATGQPACRSALLGEDPECVPWDIFAFDSVSEAAKAYLNIPSLIQGTVKEQVANANATIQLGEWGIRSPWAEEAPAINFGAEYRKDRLDYIPDELAQSGDLAGVSTQIQPVHGSTSVKEVFVEGRVPLIASRLIERLALEGGYRQSWYKAGTSISTNAYKVALDLTAVRGLRFRASQQRAVRAPNVVELFYPPFTDGFFLDPCVGTTPDATLEQCQRTGVTPDQYGHIIGVPEETFFAYNALAGGNPELKPEVAKTRTLGMVLEPRFLPGFNATIDWWDIRLDGAVSYVFGDLIVDTCAQTGDPLFCERIHRGPNGTLWLSPQGFVDTKLFNIGGVRVSGIDVGARYRRTIGKLGSATLDVLGSYLRKSTIDNGGFAEPIECAGLFGGLCTQPTPRWRHKARLTWEPRDGISLSVNWRYFSKLRVNTPPGFPPPGPLSRIGSQSFFDLSALVPVTKRYTLRAGVNNVFDREPPLVPGGEAGCFDISCNGNTYPQWYDPLGRYVFAGVTLNFD